MSSLKVPTHQRARKVTKVRPVGRQIITKFTGVQEKILKGPRAGGWGISGGGEDHFKGVEIKTKRPKVFQQQH